MSELIRSTSAAGVDLRPSSDPQFASSYAAAGRMVVIVLRTADGQEVFRDLDFARACLDRLVRLCARGKARVYAYCLMPDQASFLVRIAVGTPVAQFVQRWKSLCYRQRRGSGTDPSFWESGYHQTPVPGSANLLDLAEEIWSKPVKGGLVKNFKDYPLNGSLEWHLGAAGSRGVGKAKRCATD